MLSALRLGSDGCSAGLFPAFTIRRLSENAPCRTVFVIAFSILPILYHVRREKSNVFLLKYKIYQEVQISIFYVAEKWENCLLTNPRQCG